ncbi:helix-turn-helix domain-containing protein [Weeksellaceae bacterium KMM 9713]|uniref:Helix-turn-helix domain-containing protein n=1 Tax=Profundicola chukchiensis TaxID=2961959 RepID=A0A9X4MVT6_9FLAO|nr:helix-turn-helix transcriptional regulator [Profundicola chukchiensis]MDG4945801.1 helix-turn-helix domain-containing protein [Profundicola chukchiensis]
MDYRNIIEEILEVYNINASEFADRIEVQRSSISHILSGRNKPSLDFLIKVKDEFPELRWDYLLLAKKPMTEIEAAQINRKIEPLFAEEMEEESKPPLHSSAPEVKPVAEKADELDSQSTKKTRSITKIVWFYDDNSFEVFEN